MEKPSNEAQAGEIDLGQLFTKIGDFFKSIGIGFVKLLAILRNVPLNNKILFATLIFSGGALGFYYSSFLKKSFYESTMILSSDYLNKRIVENIVDKLNLLADEPHPKGLAHELQISDTLATNIISFEAKPFVSEKDLVELEVLKEQLRNAQITAKNPTVVVEEVVKRIEIENRHAFEFTVRTYSPAAIKPLQEAFVNFLRNNEYIKKRIEVNHKLLVNKRNKLARDNAKLDSLKKAIYSTYKMMAEQGRQGSNNVILSDKPVASPVEIYSQDLQTYNQFVVAERDVFLQPDFEVVDGFTQFESPASDSRLIVIIKTMIFFFFLGYAVVAVREFNKYLSSVS